MKEESTHLNSNPILNNDLNSIHNSQINQEENVNFENISLASLINKFDSKDLIEVTKNDEVFITRNNNDPDLIKSKSSNKSNNSNMFDNDNEKLSNQPRIFNDDENNHIIENKTPFEEDKSFLHGVKELL